MAKVYTVRYLMDDETATYFSSHSLKKREKDEKEKQVKKKKEKMKWKRRK